jgi:hypothetical protein
LYQNTTGMSCLKIISRGGGGDGDGDGRSNIGGVRTRETT